MADPRMELLYFLVGVAVTFTIIILLPHQLPDEPKHYFMKVDTTWTEYSACESGLITPNGDTIPYPKK